MYVETCAPEWDKPTDPWSYERILDEIRERIPVRKIGIANVNTIPHVIYADIEKGARGAQIVPAEDIILDLRAYKSDGEIELLKEGYRITEEALKKTMEILRPGVRERELLARWKAISFEMGAEGFGYPCWVTSGPSTYQSLCKSTDREIGENEMVQFSVGAKYSGYCGNIGRVAVLGKLPQRHMDMIKIAGECLEETIATMGPGVPFAQVYDKFQARLTRYGFGGLSLYGPALPPAGRSAKRPGWTTAPAACSSPTWFSISTSGLPTTAMACVWRTACSSPKPGLNSLPPGTAM